MRIKTSEHNNVEQECPNTITWDKTFRTQWHRVNITENTDNKTNVTKTTHKVHRQNKQKYRRGIARSSLFEFCFCDIGLILHFSKATLNSNMTGRNFQLIINRITSRRIHHKCAIVYGTLDNLSRVYNSLQHGG